MQVQRDLAEQEDDLSGKGNHETANTTYNISHPEPLENKFDKY